MKERFKKWLCKQFGHKEKVTERPGSMWAISYIDRHCTRCGKFLGTDTRFHDD